MNILKPFALAATIILFAASAGTCSSGAPKANGDPIGGDVIAPVTMDVEDLRGSKVDLVVGQVLNINVDPEPVDAYKAIISDSSVAVFTAGEVTDSAQFNPGIEALAPRSTEVTFIGPNADDKASFTVEVEPRK